MMEKCKSDTKPYCNGKDMQRYQAAEHEEPYKSSEYAMMT